MSCYEDKGHYDYIPSNTIKIRIPNTAFDAVMGETFIYYPPIEFSDPTDTTGFEYWWEYKGVAGDYSKQEIVCEGRELKYIPKLMGTQVLQLCAKELRSGTITTGNLTISGGTVYTKGWLILSETNGKSNLSLIRPDRETPGNYNSKRIFTPFLNLYANMHPEEELGNGPIALGAAYSRLGAQNIIYILQQDETVCLHGQSYQKELTINQEFVGGTPANFTPAEYFQGNFSSMLRDDNGVLYYRCPPKGFSSDFFTYLFPNFPMEYEGKVLKAKQIIPTIADQVHHYSIHDKENKRFLWIYSGFQLTSGSIIPANYTPKEAHYLDYNNTGDAEILYTESFNETASMMSSTVQNITVYSLNGKVYAQQYQSSMTQNMRTMPTGGLRLMNVNNYEFPGAEYLSSETKFYRLKTNRPYLFFATGTQLYWCDYMTGQIQPFYTFNSGEKVLKMLSNPQETELAVLLENGKFIVLDIQNENLMGTDNKIYEIQIPGDRVVDMIYKYATYAAYSNRKSSGRD